MTRSINQVAIIGTGVIGASWSALFLAKGLEVVATDVAPGAEAALRRFCRGGLAGSQKIRPRARCITIESDVCG